MEPLPRLNLREVVVVVLGHPDNPHRVPLVSWLKLENRDTDPAWVEHVDTAAMFKDVMRTAHRASGPDDDDPILLCSFWLSLEDKSPFIEARLLRNDGDLATLLLEMNLIRKHSAHPSGNMPHMVFWLEGDNDTILEDVPPAQVLAAQGQRENDGSEILPGEMDIGAGNGGG
jgi:hypothetical protein